MPELPEVEVTRRGLSCTVGGTVADARVRAARLRDPVPDLPKLLKGLRLAGIERRAKYLIWRFESAEGKTAGWLVTHLGMSGFWRLWPNPAPAPRRHDHIDITIGPWTARLTDPRRFGTVLWMTQDPYRQKPLKDLGPEPFDSALTAERFWKTLHAHRTSIKAVLLSGRAAVGCGNIYCSETLFEAGIRPTRRADRVTKKEAERLLAAIRGILERAIKAGGTTLRDFHGPGGQDGYFALECRVYGREGGKCPACGGEIRRIVQNGRSSYFCPHCQK